jgi:hypothetical protein
VTSKDGFYLVTRHLSLVTVLLRFFDLDYFTAVVETALRTDAMRHPRLLAIRAGRGLRLAQGIVRPALSGSRF